LAYLYGLGVFGNGFVVLAFVVVGFPSVEVGLSKFRLYLNGLAVIRDGFAVLAFVVVGFPSVEVGLT
jgi:formate hydrogenlyase subunit 3/multisubunit Na+/H+ antiporter MnhD subunit